MKSHNSFIGWALDLKIGGMTEEGKFLLIGLPLQLAATVLKWSIGGFIIFKVFEAMGAFK